MLHFPSVPPSASTPPLSTEESPFDLFAATNTFSFESSLGIGKRLKTRVPNMRFDTLTVLIEFESNIAESSITTAYQSQQSLALGDFNSGESLFAATNLMTIDSCASTSTFEQFFVEQGIAGPSRLLSETPWFRFQDIMGINVLTDPSFSPATPVQTRYLFNSEDGRQLLSTMIHSQQLEESVAIQDFGEIVKPFIPERFSGDIKEKLQQLVSISGDSDVTQFAELPLGLISNNLMPEEGVERFVDLIMKYQPRSLLRRLFIIDTPTVQAVLTTMMENIAKKGDVSTLKFLIDAGPDRSKASGRNGGRLLQIAAKARRTEVVEYLLQTGANVNPELQDQDWETFNWPPLHHAVSNRDVGMMEQLLAAGASVNRTTEYDGTALSVAVKNNISRCVSVLIKSGAMVDDCKVADDRFYSETCYLGALDYAYLKRFRSVYNLLLPHSQKVKLFITTNGVLSAAEHGVQGLEAYINAKTQTLKQKELDNILEHVLKDACYYKDFEEAIGTLLEFGVDPNLPGIGDIWVGDLPLILAASDQDIGLAELLIDAGANINNEKILRTAVEDKNNVEFLCFLIENEADLDLFGSDALCHAILHSNISAVKILIRSGVDPNKPNSIGNYPMEHAAGLKNLDIARYLLEHSADVNPPPSHSSGFSPLQNAVRSLNLEMIKLLIHSGASVKHPGRRFKKTLLEVCAEASGKDSPEASNIFRYLLTLGAEIQNPNHRPRSRRGNSMLTNLIKGHVDDDLIFHVLDSGVEINQAGTGYNARTPIQAAAETGNLNLVKELYSRGANINAPAAINGGRTALQAACSVNNNIDIDLVRFLLEHEADVNAQAGTKAGLTALQGAAIKGNISLALLLIEDYEAEVNALPAVEDGRMALDGAAEHGRLDMVQVLLNAGAKSEVAGQSGYDRAVELAEEQGHWAVVDLLKHFTATSQQRT
jgi:ankyrin repeat protein